MIEDLLPSFRSELIKLAENPTDWKEFEKGLKNRTFQQKALSEASDPKLKKYIKSMGGLANSKDLKAKVQSDAKPSKDYQIKTLSNGRLACTCGDWRYKHSVRNTDCKHIKLYRRYLDQR